MLEHPRFYPGAVGPGTLHPSGAVGSSDLRGTIEEDPGQERPVVAADLASYWLFPQNEQ